MKKIMPIMLGLILALGLVGCATQQYVHVGENWAALNNLEPSGNVFRVMAWGPETIQVGEQINFRILSAEPGRLWVVQVDPEDNLSLLFPNDLSRNNTINDNVEVHIPPADAAYSIEASEPAGRSVVAFIVTQGSTDLNEALTQKDGLAKALELVRDDPAWGLRKLVIDVKGAGK